MTKYRRMVIIQYSRLLCGAWRAVENSIRHINCFVRKQALQELFEHLRRGEDAERREKIAREQGRGPSIRTCEKNGGAQPGTRSIYFERLHAQKKYCGECVYTFASLPWC